MSAVTIAARAAQTAAGRVAANRGGLVFTGVFYLMVTGVLAALWTAAAEVNGGHVVGYSASALIWYVATSEAATIALPQRLIEEIGDDVKNGVVEVEMLRPASVLMVRISSQAGATLVRVAICVSFALLFGFVVAGRPGDGWALALAAPSLLMALMLGLIAQHAFASIAFWVRDATAIWFLYQKFIFVFGGMLLPLEVLPDAMETAARWMPFMAMAYVPARLASGHLEPELLLIQIAWIVVMSVAAAWLFAVGQRRLLDART